MNTCQAHTVQILDNARSQSGAFLARERKVVASISPELGFTSIGTVIAVEAPQG